MGSLKKCLSEVVQVSPHTEFLLKKGPEPAEIKHQSAENFKKITSMRCTPDTAIVTVI